MKLYVENLKKPVGIVLILPFRGVNLSLYKSSTAGITNAKVFPDPVFAAAFKSLPSKIKGIVRDWISVKFLKPISFIPVTKIKT